MGEKVGAVLFGGGDEIDVPAVLDHCRSQLADFKVPQYVTVVDTRAAAQCRRQTAQGADSASRSSGETPLR